MTPQLPTSFYVKLAAGCFAVGACMELFMIKTGFYDIVTQTEAERWEETKQEREVRAKQLREHLVAEYRRKGLELPPVVLEQQQREQQHKQQQ